jgi:dihydroneopterin aldolase
MINTEFDVVLIKDLVLDVSIGIYDHEKIKKQRVIINLEAYTAPIAGVSSSENINNAVSYEILVNEIKSIVDKGHTELVETLASDIAEMCLKDTRIMKVAVSIEKPDIIEEAGSVGIRIHRQR